MESIHGVDVSWIHKPHLRDSTQHQRHLHHHNGNAQSPVSNAKATTHGHVNSTSPTSKNGTNDTTESQKGTATTPTKQTSQRPGFLRSGSSERTATLKDGKSSSAAPGMPRRNSWLGHISSKFSSSPGAQSPGEGTLSPPATTTPRQDTSKPTSAPKGVAILPQATSSEGSEPYTPAPVKQPQGGFLSSALRRLSSSSGALSGSAARQQNGLCQRRILNVDKERDRCTIPELDGSKLRRVAFCVDVEIASGPRYVDEEECDTQKEKQSKKKSIELGEGEALKHRQESMGKPETASSIPSSSAVQQQGSEYVLENQMSNSPTNSMTENSSEPRMDEGHDKDTSKKKEKKKRSEEERKARKEKKRKQAEANGTVPVELVRNGSDSSLDSPAADAAKTSAVPTTDPARIYRRCCQLRETPILKKITEQLSQPANCDIQGTVAKLDLSGYWLQLPDLITLGDYLAVVPIRELAMENCGLTDEGVRVILAGLLATKAGEVRKRRKKEMIDHESPHGGVVQRVTFKNNNKIGRDGWRHICLFIHMSRSLRAMDMSMNPFPQHTKTAASQLPRSHNTAPVLPDCAELLAKVLAERLGQSVLELLNMAETGLTTEQLGYVIDGACKSGLRRLGLAGNHITTEGMGHVSRYLLEGRCEGLDLGGNDLRDHMELLAKSVSEDHPLWALSLSNCNLNPESLWKLFPSLVKLQNFKFLDLSHNHDLFSSNPSALSLLRRYLPKMPCIKRLHLTDTSMTPEQAVALAEILPESHSLAHINIMENPEIAKLTTAKDEANQEEACALFASLMAAVRVSRSMVCIDIEIPSQDSSEVVKALAKQVVAYCLRNMERGPVAEIAEAAAALTEPHGGEKEIAVPDVLLHLVGHVEGLSDEHDDDDPAPDQDYVIGGTGVVKALGICLRNRTNDSRRPSADRLYSDGLSSGVHTPQTTMSGGKAKDMSKNLLGSARKIRERLQPALLKEASMAEHAKLVYLDQTLERMINRFEDEYPETRISAPIPQMDLESSSLTEKSTYSEHTQVTDAFSEDERELRPALSRHNSDVSLASRLLDAEEGRMHRFGQQFRRDILKPETRDHLHGTTGDELWAPHLQMLRATIEELGGDEIRLKVKKGGQDAVIEELGKEASDLRQKIIESDPEAWEKFKEAQEVAAKNVAWDSGAGTANESAIE